MSTTRLLRETFVTKPIHPTPTDTRPPLHNTRVLSLALNLPGPAALMRLKALGATCTKVEPPAGDPMARYSPGAYAALHAGLHVVTADLKQPEGQRSVHGWLAHTDVLLTSFRPSALVKLGLDWNTLSAAYPQLSMVTIVGAPDARAEEAGHDLTYMAEAGLVPDLSLPPTLYADMAGALAASEAVLQTALARHTQGRGTHVEVALSAAAQWLSLPRRWGLTTPDGDVGGAHAGYRVYPCADGRVATAALEPHFASRLCQVAGLPAEAPQNMRAPTTHSRLAAWLATHTRAQLDALAALHDIPLHTLP